MTTVPLPPSPSPELLEVRDLVTAFHTAWGEFRAVDGVSLTVQRGRTLGIVGESGCGKSVTALSIMRLMAPHTGRIASGQVRLDGEDLLALDEPAMRRVRGDRIGMVFQEPMTSLNPVMRIGEQIGEGLRFHKQVDGRAARERVTELLRQVGISAPERRCDSYPHEISGGMRQRVVIAMALACDPALLLADEPTTALDVTIQAQILELLQELQRDRHMGLVLITHDLGVIAETAHDVVIMYAGQIVERGPVAAIFDDPQHPYTIGLLGSITRPDRIEKRLSTIRGQVPGASARIDGCRFSPRCPFADEHCRIVAPTLSQCAPSHDVACWKAPL